MYTMVVVAVMLTGNMVSGLSGLRGIFFCSSSGSQFDSGIFYGVFPHWNVGELAEFYGNG